MRKPGGGVQCPEAEIFPVARLPVVISARLLPGLTIRPGLLPFGA
jgi:hypothetical protein